MCFHLKISDKIYFNSWYIKGNREETDGSILGSQESEITWQKQKQKVFILSTIKPWRNPVSICRGTLVLNWEDSSYGFVLFSLSVCNSVYTEAGTFILHVYFVIRITQLLFCLCYCLGEILLLFLFVLSHLFFPFHLGSGFGERLGKSYVMLHWTRKLATSEPPRGLQVQPGWG